MLAAAFLVVSASAESKARIVRLSEVQGTVQIDRAAGDGFEKAFINLPVIEGSKLKTGKDGRAEVEFEDGSALRLAPDSEVDFTRLALGDDGQKLSTVQLVSGTVYANLHPKKAHDKENRRPVPVEFCQRVRHRVRGRAFPRGTRRCEQATAGRVQRQSERDFARPDNLKSPRSTARPSILRKDDLAKDDPARTTCTTKEHFRDRQELRRQIPPTPGIASRPTITIATLPPAAPALRRRTVTA